MFMTDSGLQELTELTVSILMLLRSMSYPACMTTFEVQYSSTAATCLYMYMCMLLFGSNKNNLYTGVFLGKVCKLK